MYENQSEGMAFHELLPVLPAGVRGRIEGVAQRALQQAGVECDITDSPGSYSRIIGNEALQGMPVIVEAQTTMRQIYDAHFEPAEV
ncbi:MAG TPA: hypothetical protein VJ843_02240 [Candidatus Saccharimonadales bacterium]|nr:hypothetical protein [Candidatus Saccharimonadales bacterium]